MVASTPDLPVWDTAHGPGGSRGSGDMMREFRDRVAVVTGGASGIGRAMATRFATEGMRLVIGDVEEPALEAAVAELRAGGADVVGVPTDVSVAADVEALRDGALEAFGAVHVVCNNAGVGGSGLVGAPLEVWEWVIGVNLWGVVHGIHTFLPLLLEQDEGHIVNTASLAGLAGVPGLGIYCTTKFAVVGLSESLWYDLEGLGAKVGVSVLCPGFVQTQIGESARNAPGTLARWTGSESARATRDAANALAAAGIPPAQVADAVFEAIGDDRFFVLPHTHAALATTRGRLAWMEGGDAPRPDPTRALQP
jgi:NAD(P)-dependent dehydrogenase (short-subunit alcohol dehydrogenase family)